MGISLVVGLGNPEQRYADTRHNAGARFVERLARHAGADWRGSRRCRGRLATLADDAESVHLLLPDTAMNLSGESVAPALRYFGIATTDMLVAHDELDLPLGVARYKCGGGHGGHNGIRDVIVALGGDADFYRLRLGIGRPRFGEVTPHVLGRLTPAEAASLDAVAETAAEALPWLLNGAPQRAMTQLHTALPSAPPADTSRDA